MSELSGRPAAVKCLVWDLDGTLWRGTLLEGDGLALVPGVIDVVRGLDERGILQAVASRNDHDDAWLWMRELGLADYFVLPHIGWGRKSDAVRAIAAKLNFAHRAMAFIDDQPVERAEVAFHLPEVRCYSADQAGTLLSLPEFATSAVTADGRNRRAMYQAGLQRDAARAAFAGPDEDFLRSLDMVLRISRASPGDLLRLGELTLRTSQMNATGVYYSEDALGTLLTDPGHQVLVLAMADRLGPHGAIGVALVERQPDVWHLKLLATSCRVVTFGVGAVSLRWLIDQAARAEVHLVADFRGTERNRIMEVTYRFAGLADDQCACQAQLRPGSTPEIQRLHLIPARQTPPGTLKVIGPDLAGSALGTADGETGEVAGWA